MALTDSQWAHRGMFRNTTYIVMTSNWGRRRSRSWRDPERQHAAVWMPLVSEFPAGIYQRIDEVVVFEPLGKEQMAVIANASKLQRLGAARLAEREVEAGN